MDDVISVLANAVQRIAISGTFYNAKCDIDVLVYPHYAIAVWAICAKNLKSHYYRNRLSPLHFWTNLCIYM